MFNPQLDIGQVIDNQKLCSIFRCGPQGGMRKSNSTNTLVIIANYVKGIYHDKWIGGVLHYTGMGLYGNQDIDYMQNYTLNHAKELGIDVFLFQVMEERKYTYSGRVELVGSPYKEIQRDENGQERSVWMFPVKPVPDNDVAKPWHYVFKNMEEYNAKGQNIDKVFNEFKKQNKGKKIPIYQSKPETTVSQELPKIETEKLKGKRIKHKRFGNGEIVDVHCRSNGDICINVQFDNEIDGIKERTLMYQACIKKNLVEVIS